MGFRYKYSLLRCASGVIIGTVFSSAQHITLQACNLYVTTFGNPICNLFVTHSETICRAPTEVFAVNPDGSISAPGRAVLRNLRYKRYGAALYRSLDTKMGMATERLCCQRRRLIELLERLGRKHLTGHAHFHVCLRLRL